LRTGVLLVNLGTPLSPSVKHVRKYLREFLNDPRVIDISPVGRFLLVNGIIVPFRSPKTSKLYQRLWTENGSPLLHFGKLLKSKVQQTLPDNYFVELAMRYQEPSIESGLRKLQEQKIEKLIIIPLYPQYAISSTGSTLDKIMTHLRWWNVIPEIKIISQFPTHPLFIDAFAENIKKFDVDSYDKILFSYHGLPERQVDKTYTDGKPCSDHSCENEWNDENRFCYKAACYATTRALATKLGLSENKYEVVFQSRLGRAEWIKPYAEPRIRELPKEGIKKVLMCSPSFVADCLETTIEIGEEYKELFIHEGGEKLDMVPSLNDNDTWVKCVNQLITG
jgi:protoporphyrin/coproporphyrin ferrochelatase